MKSCCEFSRKIPLNRIQKKELFIKIEADDKEKKALAERFYLPDVHFLYADYKLQHLHGGQIRAQGKIIASIIQICVLSLEEFKSEKEESFELMFIPIHKVGKELEGINDPDIIPYDHDEIDLGEATAEQLALLLDPYPHKPNVIYPLILQKDQKDKILENNETKENPFKVLGKLKNIHGDKKK